MAARRDVMRRSKVHEGIGGRKIIAIRLRMRCAPFHLILGHEDGALLGKERYEFRALKLGV